MRSIWNFCWASWRRARCGAPVRRPGLLLTLGCAGFLGGVLASDLFALPLLARLVLGGCAAMGIVGLCGCEQRYGWRFGRLPVLLGAASYSVYLTHGTTLSVLAHGLARLRGAVAPDAALAGLVLAGALAGVAYWRIVERPLLRWVNRFTP
jgi:exopolysaccharide production protein ExoZ